MLSRLREPDDEGPAVPVVWRHVSGEAATAAEPVQEDLAARMKRLEQDCERRVREARAAAMREGEAAGRSGAAAELQPVIERLSRSIDELARLRPQLRRNAEGDMVKLSLAIARRVLRRELAIDPDALHGLVLAALEKLQGQEICRVKVHPSLSAAVSACLRASAAGQEIEIAPDPSREPGAVVFETRRGNLDASVESQLQEIERGLADRLRKQI